MKPVNKSEEIKTPKKTTKTTPKTSNKNTTKPASKTTAKAPSKNTVKATSKPANKATAKVASKNTTKVSSKNNVKATTKNSPKKQNVVTDNSMLNKLITTAKENKDIIAWSIVVLVLLTILLICLFRKTSPVSVDWTLELNSESDLYIKITDIESTTLKGKARDEEEPVWGYDTAYFTSEFKKVKDSIEYEVTVANMGDTSAVLDNIEIPYLEDKTITYKTDNLKEDSVIKPAEETTFTITLTYNKKLKNKKENEIEDLTLELEYVVGNGNKENVELTNNYQGYNTTSLALPIKNNQPVVPTDNQGVITGNNGSVLEPIITIDYGSVSYEQIDFDENEYPWALTNGVWHSTNHEDDTTGFMTYTFTIEKTSTVSFDWSVSSEENFDTLTYILLTGNEINEDNIENNLVDYFDASGTDLGDTESNLGYNNYTTTLEPGTYLVAFAYTKDESTSNGTDTAYIKNLNIKAVAPIVSISYPTGCDNGKTCSYSLNGEEYEATSNTIELEITEDTKIVVTTKNGNTTKKTETIVDFTAPEVTLNVTPSSNSITTTVEATDNLSDIVKYEFRINNGEWIDNGTNSTYKFTDLTQNENYTVEVRVTNSSGLTTVKEVNVDTISLIPSFETKRTDEGKTVTITYPLGCGENLTCSYINNGEEVIVTTDKIDVDINIDSTLVAKVTDGTNTVTTDEYKVFIPFPAEELKNKTVTSGDGLYTDPTEEDRYIYSGSKPNNYIKFNDELWRIISVEADGTIKIFKKQYLDIMPYDPGYSTEIKGITPAYSIEGTRYSNKSTDYCSLASYGESHYYGCTVWGSNTTMLDSTGTNITKMQREVEDTTTYDLPEKEAYINTYLNGEYYNSLSPVSKNLITNHLWNVGILKEKEGQTLETDIQQESAYKWKGFVGLINVTDYVKSNSNRGLCGTAYNVSLSANNYDTCKNTTWLNDDYGSFWTINKYDRWSFNDDMWILYHQYGYGFYWSPQGSSQEVNPVLYITSNIKIEGDGSIKYPYEIIID